MRLKRDIATSSASAPASERGSGWSKEAKIAIAAIVVAVLLFMTGYGIKWLSRKCRKSRQRETERTDPGPEDEDLEMGNRTPGPATTGDLEESEGIGRAHHIDLNPPEPLANSHNIDGEMTSSDAEHGSHRHSATSTDALLDSPNGQISLANSVHGSGFNTVTSTDVGGPSHDRPQSAPASSGCGNVVKRHKDQADDLCHADTGDCTKTLISGETGRGNCNVETASSNVNCASPELKKSVS
ncbi:hypothetical protein HDK90DRAFT_507419 [Phyllosticta capitalensis]|uniref:Uncharacterized protein n=1 Tax=Phyllosticta capitalensis TaxID=121624 RepID=A0ABR1YY02_9PEZI